MAHQEGVEHIDMGRGHINKGWVNIENGCGTSIMGGATSIRDRILMRYCYNWYIKREYAYTH